ncbi:hypothetical protein PLESTB_000226400 [Pleodorina starrii]|uniref:Uncharacterized protein n=1 Tax=Pleodorina starrii TaxID=330485 RepID=A0A9W6BC95_9CHLO|nr:hypothetical protein PLESTM_002055900 [Pleodorina starrii]GLC49501.1 hypothetical protein PLESTB_000226100 [Pleodorina starrii]GLC49502.1 hypothetical protein PLESTB_000226200 [Pleodorina starrii]GLC49503.1 hypothetical protein PLESTB_000226300 [Pleodorina starrii]GLC49504.1 hypothetical protein PLESTB_000226400 [Pleodorina starrii]
MPHSVGRRMESCSLTTRDGSFGSAASGSRGGMVGVRPGEGMAQLQPDGNGGWDLASGDGPLPSIQQQQLLLHSKALAADLQPQSFGGSPHGEL